MAKRPENMTRIRSLERKVNDLEHRLAESAQKDHPYVIWGYLDGVEFLEGPFDDYSAALHRKHQIALDGAGDVAYIGRAGMPWRSKIGPNREVQ